MRKTLEDLNVNFWLSNVLLISSPLLGLTIYLWLKYRIQGKLSLWQLKHFIPFFLVAIYFSINSPKNGIYIPGMVVWITMFELAYLVICLCKAITMIIAALEQFKTVRQRFILYKFFGVYIILICTVLIIIIEYVYIGLPGPTLYLFILAVMFGIGTIVLLTIDMAVLKEYNVHENLSELDKTKYANSGLSEELLTQLALKLELIMIEKKTYLNNDLKLDDLAQNLSVSRHHLSQIINQKYNLGFYDYINKFRIKEAKKLIKIDSNSGVTEIAYTVGFNNRVSFYKAFKKFAYCTPTEYRELQKIS